MAALSKDQVIAVIGAGAMGGGIAQVAAAAGHTTLLYDQLPGAAQASIDRTAKALDKRVANGKMSAEDRDALLGRLQAVEDWQEMAPAAMVVEAIVEDLAIKQDLFSRLEQLCGDQVILATNTSSISVSAIASALQRPERLVGLHFFNPAPIMRLVEIISGVATDPELAQTAFDTATAWGKQAVHARSTPGFIVNRVARPFYAEGLRLLEEGAASIAEIDAALRDCGRFRMGPFELMDLIGHDVNYAVTCSVFDAFYQDPRFLPSLIQKSLVDGGLLGRKAGRGFYDYRDGAEKPQPRNAQACEAPQQIEVFGDLGVAEPLVVAWQAKGIAVSRQDAEQAYIKVDDWHLALSDGNTATFRAADSGHAQWALFDLALDYDSCSRVALCCADQALDSDLSAVIGLFQALDKAVTPIDDTPGMIVMRTVAMLANEGADAVLQGVCDAAAVDTAMCSGVNYPLGPMAWADRIGLAHVLTVLNHLQEMTGLDRYRPSQLIKRKVYAGGSFHG